MTPQDALNLLADVVSRSVLVATQQGNIGLTLADRQRIGEAVSILQSAIDAPTASEPVKEQ
jgi:hypothetical protein